ncbi:prenylcysteine oxidase / farnesylcysteine lyase, partial [Lecanoromycetidae sp. Uapishka_2]
MYDKPVFPFKDLSQTAYDLGLTEITSSTGEQFLDQKGIGPPFSTDIIQASTRVNYAQNLDKIHGLEAMVCMATDGAMSVRGGNWQIFDNMLKASGANVQLNTSVSSVNRQPNGTYAIDATSPFALIEPTIHDTVILAAPLQSSNLTISPSPLNPPPVIPYVRLHVTLFTSAHALDPQYFNLAWMDQVPTTVLTTKPSHLDQLPIFFSISTLRLLHNPKTGEQEYLYKVFSPEPLEQWWLKRIVLANTDEAITWKYEKVWHSYPYLEPRVTFEDIQLDEEGKVWYTSGIESFISTMETSSLMGMNVAKLVVDGWGKETREKDEQQTIQHEPGRDTIADAEL